MNGTDFGWHGIDAAQPSLRNTDAFFGNIDVANTNLAHLRRWLSASRLEVDDANDRQRIISCSTRRSVSMTLRIAAKVERYSRSFSATLASKFVAAATMAP